MIHAFAGALLLVAGSSFDGTIFFVISAWMIVRLLLGLAHASNVEKEGFRVSTLWRCLFALLSTLFAAAL